MVATTATIVGRARDVTGLEDLGRDGWQTGLEHLLEAVERDCGDDEPVVRRIESLVVDRLVQRLRIERWYADNGAEAAQPIDQLLVVFGLPRTGTTALHHLLSLDPRFRYLRSWEVRDPVPPPWLETENEDPRRPADPPAADVRHITSIDGPAEDWPIHSWEFDHAELILPVPSYTRWWRSREHTTLFSHHERVLRLLHSHRPPRHWLLKFPAYLFLLPELRSHHPEACLVMTHRDPVAALASTCSTVADSRLKRTPTWTPSPTFGQEILGHWGEGMQKALAARDAPGADRFVDIAQHELEADPVGCAERVYAAAGLDLEGGVADAMGRWASENRRGSRGAHRYRLEDYGLSAGEVTDVLAPYLERFGDLT